MGRKFIVKGPGGYWGDRGQGALETLASAHVYDESDFKAPHIQSRTQGHEIVWLDSPQRPARAD